MLRLLGSGDRMRTEAAAIDHGYALGIHESRHVRVELMPYYTKILA